MFFILEKNYKKILVVIGFVIIVCAVILGCLIYIAVTQPSETKGSTEQANSVFSSEQQLLIEKNDASEDANYVEEDLDEFDKQRIANGEYGEPQEDGNGIDYDTIEKAEQEGLKQIEE